MSNDISKIFSFFIDYSDSLSNIYFTTFKTLDISILGMKYKTTIFGSSAFSSVVNGDNVIATLLCTQYYLVIYNVVSDSFTFKLFFHGYLYGIRIESGSGR